MCVCVCVPLGTLCGSLEVYTHVIVVIICHSFNGSLSLQASFPLGVACLSTVVYIPRYVGMRGLPPHPRV